MKAMLVVVLAAIVLDGAGATTAAQRAPRGFVWAVGNACAKGGGAAYRFFSPARGWLWPRRDLVYVLDSGTAAATPLACVPGEKVCIGGEAADGSFHWGVGILGRDSCPDCCRLCGAGTASTRLECEEVPTAATTSGPLGPNFDTVPAPFTYRDYGCTAAGSCADSFGVHLAPPPAWDE